MKQVMKIFVTLYSISDYKRAKQEAFSFSVCSKVVKIMDKLKPPYKLKCPKQDLKRKTVFKIDVLVLNNLPHNRLN